MPFRSAAIAALLLLAGCVSGGIETAPASAPLAPVTPRLLQPGDVFVWERADGTRITDRVTGRSADGAAVTYETDFAPSCRGLSTPDYFAPILRAESCDGSWWIEQEAETDGVFAPLAEGARHEWRVSSRWSNGNSERTRRTCRVTGTARVAAPAGAFDTWEVHCTQGGVRRTFWYAPALGTAVAYDRVNRRNERLSVRLVSFTPGEG